MKKTCIACASLIAVLLAIVAVVRAERTRTEITRATNAIDDSKPNSSEVPEGIAAVGSFKRVLVLRFKYQTDLLSGIESLVRQHHVTNAVILSGIGSVRNYHIHAVSNRT
ncbi:MAG TPA: DUF296 domain-containing protein, partial [Pirellulales bacterium]|nr:DUF296 domain-containing protein [Pirellulales bacterium]